MVLFDYSRVIIAVFVLSSTTESLENVCEKQKPSSCAISFCNCNSSFVQAQIKKSFVSIEGPSLNYIGDIVNIIVTIDVAEIEIDDIRDNIKLIAYVTVGNKICEDNTRCKHYENGTIRKRVCTFNLTKSDNGTEVYFYGFYPNFHLLKVCFNEEPIILIVKGVPSYIHLSLLNADSCNGIINITTNSTVDNDTILEVKVFTDSELVEEGTIPHDKLEYVFTANNTSPLNGTIEFVFVVTPVNDAGSGPPSNISVELSYNTNNYTVSNVSVEVGADGTFIGVAHLQVNDTNAVCPFAGPSHVEVSSTCSDNSEAYTISSIHDTINVPLTHGQRNCSFNVLINSVRKPTIDTGQDTFYTKSCNHWVDIDRIVVKCRFINVPLVVNGAWVTVLDFEGVIISNETYSFEDYLNSSNRTILCPFVPGGNYTLLIHDRIKGKEFNVSETAAFSSDFRISKTVVTSSDEPPTTCSAGEDCATDDDGIDKSNSNLGYIIGFPLLVCICIIIIVVVTGLGIWKYSGFTITRVRADHVADGSLPGTEREGPVTITGRSVISNEDPSSSIVGPLPPLARMISEDGSIHEVNLDATKGSSSFTTTTSNTTIGDDTPETTRNGTVTAASNVQEPPPPPEGTSTIPEQNLQEIDQDQEYETEALAEVTVKPHIPDNQSQTDTTRETEDVSVTGKPVYVKEAENLPKDMAVKGHSVAIQQDDNGHDNEHEQAALPTGDEFEKSRIAVKIPIPPQGQPPATAGGSKQVPSLAHDSSGQDYSSADALLPSH